MSADCTETDATVIRRTDTDILSPNDKLADPITRDVPSHPLGADILSPSDNCAETIKPASAIIPAEPAGTAVFSARHDVPEPIEPGRADVPIEIPETEIYPGEDPDQFRRLHQRLIQEWEPSGPIEEDAVLTLATDLWRKRRFHRWQRRRLDFDAHGQRTSELEYLEQEPAPFPARITDEAKEVNLCCGAAHIDDFVSLLVTSNELLRCNNPFWAHCYLIRLSQYERHLNQRVPPKNYDEHHIRDYVRDLKQEIDTVLIPRARDELRNKFGSIDEEKLITAALAPERIRENLKIESQFDAAIDRSLKRLTMMKMKGREKLAPDRQSRINTNQFSRATSWGRIRYVH